MPYYKDNVLFNKFVKTTALDALFYFVIYLYLSFLSPYFSTLGWSESLKGLFFSLFSVIGIFVAPILGTISDKIGRYKVIIIGFFLETIALVGYITIQSAFYLFLIRIISAIAFNAVTITAISRINDTVEDDSKRSRLNGIFQTVLSISAITAPLIGGFVADYYGYTMVFTLALVVIVIILLGLLLFDTVFYDDNRPHRKKDRLKFKDLNPFVDVLHVLSFSELRKITVLGAITNFTAPLMILVIPFLLVEEMGLSNAQLSIAVFVMGIGHLLQFFAGRIADKIGKRKTIALGLMIGSFALVSLFFARTYELILLFLFVKSIGGALFNISMWSYMSDIAEKYDIEGKVIGSYSSLSRIFIAISFAVGGVLLGAVGNKIFLLYAFFVIFPVILFSKLLFGKRTSLKSSKS